MTRTISLSLFFLILLLLALLAKAEDGLRLWLRYDTIIETVLLQQYKSRINSVYFSGSSSTRLMAESELVTGLPGLPGQKIVETKSVANNSPAACVNPHACGLPDTENDNLGKEGVTIRVLTLNKKNVIALEATTGVGTLYVFHLLRLLQTGQNIQQLNISSVPKIQDHWNNLNRHVKAARYEKPD